MEQLEFLEQELIMLQENIQRLKNYQQLYKGEKWVPSHSLVVGEFKHRLISLKQRLTLASNINTYDLCKDNHSEGMN